MLTHIGVNSIRARGGINKNRLRKYTIIREKQLQKRNVATLNSAPHIKQKRCETCVNGYTDSRALYIVSSEFCQSNRNLFRVWKKLNESIFKRNNQINSAVTTRTWVFPKEWIRTWPNTGLVSEWKKVVAPVCLNGKCCSLGCMGIVLTKIKGMNLCLYWVLEEMLSMQFFWNNQRKTNYLQAI